MTETLPREKREELRRLCDAATPGPWEVDSVDTEDGRGKYQTSEIASTSPKVPSSMNVVVEFSNATVAEIHEDGDDEGYYSRWDETSRRNAAFIAAAREWLPVLLDMIPEQQEGGDPHSTEGTDSRRPSSGSDKSPPVSAREPGRATGATLIEELNEEAARWSDDGPISQLLTRAANALEADRPAKPISLVLETTEEEIKARIINRRVDERVCDCLECRLLRDVATLLADNARLTAEVSRLTGELAEAAKDRRDCAQLLVMGAERVAAAREEEREADARAVKIVINHGDEPKLERLLGGKGSVYRMIIAGIAEDAIRARSQSARSVPEILDDVRQQNAMPPGSEHWEAGQS